MLPNQAPNNELNVLRSQLQQAKSNAEMFLNQIEAGKQALGEQLQVGLNLRASLISFQKKLQEVSTQLQNTQKELQDSQAKVHALLTKYETKSQPEVNKNATNSQPK